MSELKGWYSGKYDSTKQKKVICEVGVEPGFLKYKTSVRLEMLLSGLVVITDAQWYDGFFFSYMATEKGDEFEDFMQFILKGFEKDAVPLAIRRRETYMDMFKKSFLFSSIINEELQKFIFNIWNDNKKEMEKVCSNLQSYLDFIERELKDKKNWLLDDFYQFRKGIEKLATIDERLFVCWKKTKDIPEKMKEAKPKLLALLTQYTDGVPSSSKRIIEDIKQEINKGYPNRSEVKNNIKALADNFDNRRLEEQFMHIFDHHYNYGIAKQHECRYYDLHDVISNSKYDKEKDQSMFLETQYFPKEIINYLGGLTWLEFSDIFYDDEVTEERNKWLENFDKRNAEKAKKSFYSYLDCIMKKMKTLNTWIINNSIFYRTSGTKRFVNITINEVGRMIGGASSDYIIDSDEVCLFFGDDFTSIERDKIVRYASTDDVTSLFDTVFAPIESLIDKREKDKNNE